MVIEKCRLHSFSGVFYVLGGGGGWGEVAIWEYLSVEEYVMGEEKFNEGGSGFSSITIKKNNEKINMKKSFQLKVRNSIKTWREQKLLRIWEVLPLLNTSLFMLKYF